MASCDEFEIDLERLAGGSLPEDRRAALEEHLSTCEGCRRYQATVAETTQALRTTDAPAWAELRAGGARLRREQVELDVTAGALAGMLGPILFWAWP